MIAQPSPKLTNRKHSSPLTAAQRTALVLRDNRSSRFSVAFSRNVPGINTVAMSDQDKTQVIKRASI